MHLRGMMTRSSPFQSNYNSDISSECSVITVGDLADILDPGSQKR
jgi:hypothetical protein